MTNTATQTEVTTGLTEPNLWNVKCLNDDFTPMDFVIELLVKIFNKSQQEATDLTMRIHESDYAVVGTYTKDIAHTKVSKATHLAESEGHPLRLVAEIISI